MLLSSSLFWVVSFEWSKGESSFVSSKGLFWTPKKDRRSGSALIAGEGKRFRNQFRKMRPLYQGWGVSKYNQHVRSGSQTSPLS